jgi:hypothetical protein
VPLAWGTTGVNEAPRSKLRPQQAAGYQSGMRRSLTRLRSNELRRVHLAFHPCSKLQGIQAKANKKKGGFIMHRFWFMARKNEKKLQLIHPNY